MHGPERRGDLRAAENLAARERESQDAHLRSARAVTGYAIRATDGDLGHVEDFLIDEQDWARWPGPHVPIATDWLRGVDWNDSVVEVDVTREAVRGARRYEPTATFGRQDEIQLYAQHRRPGYWDRRLEAWRYYPPAA